MEELERRVLEVADLVERERPEVARRLRDALAESRQRFIVAQMAAIRSLLSQEDYGAASERQRRVLSDLAAFVALLDPVRTAEDLELLRRAAERIAALSERQARAAEGTRAAPDGAGPYGDLAAEQAGIRQSGAAVLGELWGATGSARLQAGLARMAAAEAALGRGRKADALEDQLAAVAELQAALEQVREAIRRLAEGSVETIRSRLREHLAAMLKAQIAVRLDTLALHAEKAARGEGDRAYRLAAAELARRQEGVAASAGDAATLVKQGGGSPAISVALAGFTEEAGACAGMLAEGVTGPSVTDSQGDLESVLQSLLSALAGELAPPEGTEMPERKEGERRRAQSLIGIHAELEVLADLQLTLKARTARVERARGSSAGVPPWAAAEAERIGRGQSQITGVLRRIDEFLTEMGIQ
jgi:hypothetical protein